VTVEVLGGARMIKIISFALFGLLIAGAASAQFALRDVLGRYPELSKFTELLDNSTTLSTRFFSQLTNFTLLAPNNDAITTWLSTNISGADIDAALEYHLLFGRYSTVDITESPVPIQSWLSDTKYVNITGGQRVEAFSNATGIFFESGTKLDSKVVTGVSFYFVRPR